MPAMFTNNRWPFTVFATSAQGNYPPLNLNVIDNHPLLYSWRSNNQLTQQDLICDIGGSHGIAAVAVLNLNVTSVQLSWSGAGVTYTDFTGPVGDPDIPVAVGGIFPVDRNPLGFYRNLIVIQPVTAGFVRVRIPAQGTTNGKTSFEVGMIWIANTLNTFPSGPEVGLRQTPKRDYIRGGHNVATAGPWYSQEEWQATMNKNATAFWSGFALNGEETPQLIYKNLGNRAEVGIFRLRDAVTFVRTDMTVVVNPTLEEMA